MRCLEIGPGGKAIPGFETLDIMPGKNITHVADASGPLPFADGSFDIVYASHIIEHVFWKDTVQVLAEWRRIIAPSGRMEIWTVNGYELAKSMIRAEEHPGAFDPGKCRQANRRFINYPKLGIPDDPNWHRAIFTPRYLKWCLEEAGFVSVEPKDRAFVRAKDHGWINMGFWAFVPEERS